MAHNQYAQKPDRLRTRWAALAPRERTLILATAVFLSVTMLWQLLLAPALNTLRSAPSRHAALDAQLQHMYALQAQAQQLKETPRVRGDATLHTLRTTLVQQLGTTAQLSVAGEYATITLQQAPAQALAQWLAQMRASTNAVPQQAHLTRATANLAQQSPPRWSGTLVLALPSSP